MPAFQHRADHCGDLLNTSSELQPLFHRIYVSLAGMEAPSCSVPGMERAIHTLDSTRLLLMAESLRAKFHSKGVDLQAPCGDYPGKTKCWLRLHLQAVNEILWKVYVQVVEHAPGVLTLSCVENGDVDTLRTDTSLQDAVVLMYTLLERHTCIKRLHLSPMAFPLWHFPSLFGSALNANQGITEVEGHPVDMGMTWRLMCQSTALACALGNLAPRLNCLNVTSVRLDHISAECIANGITKSNMRRLHLCSQMSASVTRKLLSAVDNCPSITSLELAGITLFSRPNAIALATALKRNRTLTKLRAKFLADGVVGIILASLKHNETLQELSLDYSIDCTHSTLWDGLQALRENRALKRLEITDACFSNSCAIVMAEILQHNKAIEELSLSMNSFSDLGARALAETLLRSSSLKRLDVSNCRLTSRAVSKFVEAVSQNNAVELVCLGHVDMDDDWEPTLPLSEDVCARLQVSWNTQALQQWTACIKREGLRSPKACLGWTTADDSSSIAQWFSSARVNSASLVELVINCPHAVDADSTEAVVSFLEATPSLKKLVVRPLAENFFFSTAVLKALARNKSVREAEFDQALRAHLDIKAIQALLLANRTLHRLKFSSDMLPSKAPVMLAHALHKNFVFLTLEFQDQHTLNDMLPLVSALNRNQSLLNRAVECVLDSARDERSTRALRLLSATESLLDAVSRISGKVREECQCLVLEAVRSLERERSEGAVGI